MLLGNYNIFLKNPVTYTGGDSVSGIVGLRSNWNTPGLTRNRFYGENWLPGTADRFGVPSAYASPYAWTLPPHSGGIGCNTGMAGASTLTGNGALGMNMEMTIAGFGEISNLNMGLIISAILSISGIGGLTASMTGALNASMTMAGQGNMSGAIGALANMVMQAEGQGQMTALMTAKGNMTMDIYVNQSTATVNELVAGVWNALAADFNDSGTMGNKLNGAGSAGDPWTTDLTPYTTPGTAGDLVKKASKPKISL
jgi:hypothetical protein